MKRLLVAFLALLILLLSACKSTDYPLMEYDFDLSMLERDTIWDEDAFQKFMDANRDGLPEGFVTWEDVAFLGDMHCFRPNGMINFPYEYFYQVDDASQGSVRYRLHICHGMPKDSRFEFLYGELPEFTLQEASGDKYPDMTFATPYRVLTNNTEISNSYYRVNRGKISYIFAPNGKIEYIFWTDGDITFALNGAGDYSGDLNANVVGRLLSKDDSVVAAAADEIIAKFHNR